MDLVSARGVPNNPPPRPGFTYREKSPPPDLRLPRLAAPSPRSVVILRSNALKRSDLGCAVNSQVHPGAFLYDHVRDFGAGANGHLGILRVLFICAFDAQGAANLARADIQ